MNSVVLDSHYLPRILTDFRPDPSDFRILYAGGHHSSIFESFLQKKGGVVENIAPVRKTRDEKKCNEIEPGKIFRDL